MPLAKYSAFQLVQITLICLSLSKLIAHFSPSLYMYSNSIISLQPTQHHVCHVSNMGVLLNLPKFLREKCN